MEILGKGRLGVRRATSVRGTHQTGPAIEWIDSEGHRADAIDEFYRAVIAELGKRHFEPQGQDVWQAASDIYAQTNLLHKLRTKTIETHPYVVVDRDTPDEDILEAARTIRAIKGRKLGGRPPRKKLVAIASEVGVDPAALWRWCECMAVLMVISWLARGSDSTAATKSLLSLAEPRRNP
jgi:hypothetical protein